MVAANDRLDQERNKREERPVVKVDLHLRGRELESPEQIEALLRELEERLLPLLKTKQRIRIV
jgi:translation initiation factor IF-3